MTLDSEHFGESDKDSDTVLFIVFRRRLTLALAAIRGDSGYEVASVWQLGDALFHEIYSSFATFYDWLRDRAGRVIGVRFWLDSDKWLKDGELDMRHYLKRLHYVATTNHDHALEVYFSTDYRVAEGISGDQAFYTNSVLASEQGEWAITLRVTDFDMVEMAGVQAADADWISATPIAVSEQI